MTQGHLYYFEFTVKHKYLGIVCLFEYCPDVDKKKTCLKFHFNMFGYYFQVCMVRKPRNISIPVDGSIYYVDVYHHWQLCLSYFSVTGKYGKYLGL